MLIKFKAKVNILSEDDMESAEKDESMGISREGKWVYRDVAYPVESIEKIIAHSSKKCLVYIYSYSGTLDSILVDEPFDILVSRWEELLKEENEASEQDLIV